jgi:hypothetical protein
MIVLGFGITEEHERVKIKNFFLSELAKGKNKYDISKAWNAEKEKYDKLPREEAPERYTKFWVYDDKIHYMHINRQHALSPDGWACLMIDEPIGQDKI